MPARRIALILSLSYLVAHAIASSYTLAALWDWHVFQDHWFDHAWELELAYRAQLGEWSGRDFHYARGPLWQLVAYLASAPWGPLEAAGTLGAIDLLFHLAAIAAVTWMVLARVGEGGRRLAALWAIGAVSWAAGVPTARALLSVVIVLLYLPPRDQEEPNRWRRPAMVAAAVVVALLLSFDRFGVAGLSLAAMVFAELAHRWRTRDRPRLAVRRAGLTLLAIAVGIGAVALVGLPFGWSPLDYVEGQRSLAAGYATGMRTPWYVGVPPINVAALFLCGAVLVGMGLALRWPRRHVVWIAGALPAAVFGAVTSDAGHMLMAILPLICVLVIVTVDARGAPWMRTASGLLAAVILVGWIGTYPSALSVHPRVFAEAWGAAAGDKRPDVGFVNGHSAAVGVVRQIVAREDPRCVALWPSLTVAHAMARVPGPTQLALRWSDTQQRELAARIAEADCPIYVHDLGAFDAPGESWFLGPDFVEIVERYRLERRVGPGIAVLRRREAPRRLARSPIASPALGEPRRVPLPGELVIHLEEPIGGEELLAMRYRLGMSAWKAQLGGTPWGEWRFERDGGAVSPWQPLHHLSALADESEVFLSPDPEALERRWVIRQRLERRRLADALRIRLRPRSRLTPEEVELTILGLTRLRLPEPPPGPPARYCHARVDLLDAFRAGRASPRNTSPRVSEVHFHLDRNVFPFPDAEIFFPIRPCPESCFSGLFRAEGADDVEVEVHQVRAADRPRLIRLPIPANGEEIPIEVALDHFVERPQWLRLGVPSDDSVAFVTVTDPAVGPCSARRWVAEALADGLVRIERGAARARGRDIELRSGDARLRLPLRVIERSCVGMGLVADAPHRTRAALRVWVDGVGHVLHDERLELGAAPTGFVYGLHDFVGREVELEVEVTPERPGTPVRLLGPHLYRCVE